MNRLVGVILFGVAVGAAVYFYERRPDDPAVPSSTAGQTEIDRYWVPVDDDQPSVGPRDALVTIVEFSDFECVYCARMVDTLNELRGAYGDDVRIVWRNMPADMHRNATVASRLAMEAYAQGGNDAFWKMHDLLFENQRSGLDPETLRGLARELGLGMSGVDAALENEARADAIEKDIELGVRLGLPGTPVYFVNGREVQGAIPRPMFRDVVNEELATAKALVSEGTPRSRVYEELTEDGKVEGPDLPSHPIPNEIGDGLR